MTTEQQNQQQDENKDFSDDVAEQNFEQNGESEQNNGSSMNAEDSNAGDGNQESQGDRYD